jgi:hypothetical protein
MKTAHSLNRTLRFWRDAGRFTSLADFYRAFAMAFLRGCYHQILGPRRDLPKFANGFCRYSGAWVYLDPHLIWQPTKSYVECGNALGLISHKDSLTARHQLLDARCGRAVASGAIVRYRAGRDTF